MKITTVKRDGKVSSLIEKWVASLWLRLSKRNLRTMMENMKFALILNTITLYLVFLTLVCLRFLKNANIMNKSLFCQRVFLLKLTLYVHGLFFCSESTKMIQGLIMTCPSFYWMQYIMDLFYYLDCFISVPCIYIYFFYCPSHIHTVFNSYWLWVSFYYPLILQLAASCI